MKFEDLAKTFAKVELPDSEVELTGEIPADVVLPYRKQALKHIASELEMPGFRKGHVSTDVALRKVGDSAVLEEAVEMFMRDFYHELVEVQKVDAVGRPDIRITTTPAGGALENPVGITIRTTIYPTVEIPKEWRTLSQKVEIEVVPYILDTEVDEALESVRKARLSTQAGAKSANPSAPENASQAGIPAENLPALDDEFAKSLGQFTDLADLKVKLKENIKQDKEQKAKEKRRGAIIEALLAKVTVDVPAIFVESELDKIMSQMKEDVVKFGLAYDDYLKRMQKTDEQVREEFRDQARKRAKLQLTLNKLADDEKIEVDKEAVDTEMKHALKHFPAARPELVRIHIETVLRNEKVLQMLEGPTA